MAVLGFIAYKILSFSPEQNSTENKFSELEKKQSLKNQTMDNIHLVEAQGGSREWELWSKYAEGSMEQGKWKLQKVHLVFFSGNAESFDVVGNEGELETTSRNLSVTGKVLVKSSNGYFFESEKILYNHVSKTLISPEAMSMRSTPSAEGEMLKLNGGNLEVEINTKIMKIHGGVKGQQIVTRKTEEGEAKKPIFIQSESANFSGIDYRAHFYDHVVMKYLDFKIKSPESFFLPNTEHNLEQVIAQGGVEVTDEKRSAYSKNLEINVPTQKILMTGNPRLVQKNDELVGDKITFLEGGKKVRVEQVKAQLEQDR